MIRYRRLRGYKYELAADYELDLPELACAASVIVSHRLFRLDFTSTPRLTIRAGYCWDGPSGPAIDTKNFLRGSLVHDVLYQAMRLGYIPQTFRAAADNILARLCREDGMSGIRANWVRWAVRSFAARASAETGRPEDQDVTETAP